MTSIAPSASRLGSYYEIHGLQVSDAWIYRHYLQAVIRELLPKDRIGGCLRHVVPRKTDVRVVYSAAKKRASFRNLQTCGQIHKCPVCASRISEARASKLQAGMERWHLAGHATSLNTFTLSHNRDQPLSEVLAILKAATDVFKNGRWYQRIKKQYGIVGVVRVIEITHGDNGWHPHRHEIAFHRGLTSQEWDSYVDACKDRWIESLHAVGADGIRNIAYASTNANDAAAEYVSKYGIQIETIRWSKAREVTKGVSKIAKGDNRAPFTLAADWANGDKAAGMLFREYAAATFRLQQLKWTPGLLKRLNLLPELPDDELAAQEDTADTVLAILTVDQWKSLMRLPRDQRGELLTIAKTGDFQAVQRWLRVRMIFITRPEAEDVSNVSNYPAIEQHAGAKKL